MNIVKHTLLLALAVAAAFATLAVEVSDVTARQRWPWNNVVDVSFTVSDLPAGGAYRACLTAQNADGGTAYGARTFLSDPVVSAGANRIAWDFGADHPELYDANMRVAVSLVPYSEATPIYLKIDLSAGPNATKYPYTFTTTAPAHVRGATDEPCQTTELWLRRVPLPEQPVLFGYYQEDANKGTFYGTLTKAYYMGVFELTQRQYELVMGSNPSFFSNAVCAASRPVESVNPKSDILGDNFNVQRNTGKIASDSLLGRLRAKTGLPLTLPTAMQCEWACRGGAYGGTYWFYKVDGAEVPRAEAMRYDGNAKGEYASGGAVPGDCDLSAGTAAVGSYRPNQLGLYDMLGNVAELTCERPSSWPAGQTYVENLADARAAAGDETLGATSANPVADYLGADYKVAAIFRCYGESWKQTPNIWSNSIGGINLDRSNNIGLRLSLTVE